MNLKLKMALRIPTSLVFLAAIIPLMAGTAPGSETNAYQVSGFCNLTNYTSSGSVLVHLETAFLVAVDGEKLFIRLDPAPGSYSEWGFDGTNLYAIADGVDVEMRPMTRAAATIFEGLDPKKAGGLSRFVWLGLAGTGYRNLDSTNPVVVPWSEYGLKGAISYRWEMEPFTSPPFLPKQIVFVASEKLWEQEKRLKRYLFEPFPVRDGFIGGRFEVLRTETWNGLTIPIEFTLKRYLFDKQKTNADQHQLLQLFSVVVTNVGAPAIASFRPKMIRPTDVTDGRYVTAEMPGFSIHYTETNNRWLAKDDPWRLAMLEKQRPVYREWRRSVERGRLMNVLRRFRFEAWTAALLFVAGVAWLCLRKARGTGQ